MSEQRTFLSIAKDSAASPAMQEMKRFYMELDKAIAPLLEASRPVRELASSLPNFGAAFASSLYQPQPQPEPTAASRHSGARLVLSEAQLLDEMLRIGKDNKLRDYGAWLAIARDLRPCLKPWRFKKAIWGEFAKRAKEAGIKLRGRGRLPARHCEAAPK